MVGRLSRARATLATATAHCCSSNRLRARKAHDRSKVYQPATSAAMRRHNAIAKCGGRARVPALHGERRFLESISSQGQLVLGGDSETGSRRIPDLHRSGFAWKNALRKNGPQERVVHRWNSARPSKTRRI